MDETATEKLSCALCQAGAQFRDRRCGDYVCASHASFEIVACRPDSTVRPPLSVRPADPGDALQVADMLKSMWGETQIECLDRVYNADELPALVACAPTKIAGVLIYAPEPAALVVVVLSVMPKDQGQGIAKALLDAARQVAKQLQLPRLLVSTTNDDLPALAAYQKYGFRLESLLPARLIAHHGCEEVGFGGIPIRDEIRLELDLGSEAD